MEDKHVARHQKYVHTVLDCLEEHNLYLKPEECEFEQEEVNYLGIIIGKNKVCMDPKKLKGVANYPPSTMPTEVRKFLGFTDYYRYFIPNYSKIAWPLLDLTKKANKWDWGEHQFKAFEELKTQMCANPVLIQPNLKNGSTYNVMHWHMAWESYSCKREKMTHHHSKTAKNLFYTP
jgi:hypothetical protein